MGRKAAFGLLFFLLPAICYLTELVTGNSTDVSQAELPSWNETEFDNETSSEIVIANKSASVSKRSSKSSEILDDTQSKVSSMTLPLVRKDSQRLLKSPAETYTESYRAWLHNLQQNYDATIRPYFAEKAVNVYISIYMISLRSVSEVTMDYTVELYFREFWNDDRLSFEVSDFNRTSINLESKARALIWRPDTAIANSMTSTEPTGDSMTFREHMRVRHDGRVFQTKRVSITANCNMDLRLYPFDTQKCHLAISSYGYSTHDIIYGWHGKAAVEISEAVRLPDFDLKEYKTREIQIPYIEGNYSTLVLCFVLDRNHGYCVVQLILPSTVIVGASWISLWLEHEMQFADLISVILSILFLSYSYNNVMPKVSYVKAMDIYLGACLFFVFISLVKMAVVKYLHKRVQKAEERRKHDLLVQQLQQTPDNSVVGQQKKSISSRGSEKEVKLTNESLPADPAPVTSLWPALAQRVAIARAKLGHSSEWKCLRAFHMGSQIILPCAFIGFSLFFFWIYPAMSTRPSCGD